MSISGGIKFFEKSLNLYSDGATITASSGNDSGQYCLDKNPYTVWQSVGSDDLTTETLEITFPSSTTIDRIFLLRHNFKSYTIKYDNAGWQDFANVISIDSSTPAALISEATYSRNSSYYEFDSVTTTKIQITATLTQVVDAQKYLSQFLSTVELGTFEGFPMISNVLHSNNQRMKRALSGKVNIEKSNTTVRIDLDFRSYPGQNDIDLILDLFNRVIPFNVWMCGGRTGEIYFRFDQIGYRLQDVYNVQTSGNLPALYGSNIFTNAIQTKLTFLEHI